MHSLIYTSAWCPPLLTLKLYALRQLLIKTESKKCGLEFHRVLIISKRLINTRLLKGLHCLAVCRQVMWCVLHSCSWLINEVCWTLKIGKSREMKLWQVELSELFWPFNPSDQWLIIWLRVSYLSVLPVNIIWCQKTSEFSERSANFVTETLLNLLKTGKCSQIEFWQVWSVDHPAPLRVSN